jgi:hypothetical protein
LLATSGSRAYLQKIELANHQIFLVQPPKKSGKGILL